jgi:hypothetical protein
MAFIQVTMSLKERNEIIIILNPLDVLAPYTNKRPRWMCKHRYAKVLDYREMIYSCKVCCSYGPVKIIADELTTLRNAGL